MRKCNVYLVYAHTWYVYNVLVDQRESSCGTLSDGKPIKNDNNRSVYEYMLVRTRYTFVYAYAYKRIYEYLVLVYVHVYQVDGCTYVDMYDTSVYIYICNTQDSTHPLG